MTALINESCNDLATDGDILYPIAALVQAPGKKPPATQRPAFIKHKRRKD
jgi:hypothetical protein